jgi:hypothetical protein
MCYPDSIAMLLFDYFLINGVLMGLRCLFDFEFDSTIARILQYLMGIGWSFGALGCFALISWFDVHSPDTENIFLQLGYGVLWLGTFCVGFSCLLGHAVGLWKSWLCRSYELECYH